MGMKLKGIGRREKTLIQRRLHVEHVAVDDVLYKMKLKDPRSFFLTDKSTQIITPCGESLVFYGLLYIAIVGWEEF